MDEQDRLRLEYDRSVELLRGLEETRFRLLALVPTLSGAVVALVSPGISRLALLAIGLLGLSATLGVLVYELENGRTAGAVGRRAAGLERLLFPDGPLRPRDAHGLALGLVYGAALGGWGYLVAWGALKLAGAGHAQAAGLAAGGVLGVLAALQILRLETRAAR